MCCAVCARAAQRQAVPGSALAASAVDAQHVHAGLRAGNRPDGDEQTEQAYAAILRPAADRRTGRGVHRGRRADSRRGRLPLSLGQRGRHGHGHGHGTGGTAEGSAAPEPRAAARDAQGAPSNAPLLEFYGRPRQGFARAAGPAGESKVALPRATHAPHTRHTRATHAPHTRSARALRAHPGSGRARPRPPGASHTSRGALRKTAAKEARRGRAAVPAAGKLPGAHGGPRRDRSDSKLTRSAALRARGWQDKIALRGGRDLALRTCPSSSSPALSTQRFLRERTLTRRAADIYAM